MMIDVYLQKNDLSDSFNIDSFIHGMGIMIMAADFLIQRHLSTSFNTDLHLLAGAIPVKIIDCNTFFSKHAIQAVFDSNVLTAASLNKIIQSNAVFRKQTLQTLSLNSLLRKRVSTALGTDVRIGIYIPIVKALLISDSPFEPFAITSAIYESLFISDSLIDPLKIECEEEM
jgi:hypothetical protein